VEIGREKILVLNNLSQRGNKLRKNFSVQIHDFLPKEVRGKNILVQQSLSSWKLIEGIFNFTPLNPSIFSLKK
jgi:uncharacterized secreted protein with C-terminal beta-propeller domain